jgi:phosphoglycerate dehydrogenase-like enzyme
MKILVCDKTESECIERMRAAGLTVDTNFEITPEELPNVLPAYDGMVVRSRTKVRQPLIDACPKLKVIVRGGVGLDTIDAEYARSKGITVMNTPKASSASVAELAIGYMFALARSLYKATATMKAEKWEKKSFEGDELGGKTLGLLGIGVIFRKQWAENERFSFPMIALPRMLIEERAAEATKVFQRGIDLKALPRDNPLFYFYLAGALALVPLGKVIVKMLPFGFLNCSENLLPFSISIQTRIFSAFFSSKCFLIVPSSCCGSKGFKT